MVFVSHVIPAVQGLHHQGRGDRTRNLAFAGLACVAVENAGLRKEGHLFVGKPETFRQVPHKVIFYGESFQHVPESRKSSRRRGYHVNFATRSRKFLNLLGHGVGSSAGEVLRGCRNLVPAVGLSLYPRKVQTRLARELPRNLSEFPPDSLRRFRIGAGRFLFAEQVLKMQGLPCRRFRQGGKFFEHQRTTGQVIQQAGIQFLVPGALPPEAGKVCFYLGGFLQRQGEFTHGEQFNAVHPFDGTLGENVKGADGLDLVAVEFDTDWVRVQEAVHIYNASANRKLPHTAHHGLFYKAMIQKPGTECRRLHHVAHLQGPDVLLERSRGGQAHEQGIQGADRHQWLFRIPGVFEKTEPFF